jgi:hypothetical protein
VELIAVLEVLRRRWPIVVAGLLVAAFAGALASGALGVGASDGAITRSGYAEAQIVLDTPKPLVADLEASDATIGKQSVLLAEHLRDFAPARQLARQASVPVGELTIRTITSETFVPTQLATRASERTSAPTRYTLTVNPSSTVPIVSVVATTPDRASAARLAGAALPVLQSLTASYAPRPQRSLSARPLGSVRSITVVVGGARPVFGIVAFVGLFAMWSCALLIASGVARMWRRLAAEPAPGVGLAGRVEA